MQGKFHSNSDQNVPPPTPSEARDTMIPGPHGRAGFIQDLVVRARPIRYLPVWARYVLTTGIVFICFALRYYLEGIYPYPFLLFLPSVILSSFLFDRGTGFFSSFLSAVLAFYFFMEPHYSFVLHDIGEMLALFVFLLVGLFTASVIEALRVTVDELGIRNDELQNAENRYRAILDTAVDAIIVIDEKAVIHSFNPAAERIFGYGKNEVIGKNVKILMPPSEAKAHDGYVKHYIETGEKKIIGKGRDVFGLHKNGMIMPLELSIAEWFDSSKKRFFTGIMRDISARKESERQLKDIQEELRRANERLKNTVDEKSRRVTAVENELSRAQKLEAVGQAVSVLAHDFRNILNPMIGAASVIRSLVPKQDEKLSSLLDMLETTGEAGKSMLEDVLAFVHKSDPSPQQVDVNALLHRYEPVLRQSIDHHIPIQFRLEDNLPSCFVDPALLQRTLLNLGTNARDAMPCGGLITIETALEMLTGSEGQGSQDAQPGQYIRLSLTDTGTGMTPEILEKVLEPFYTTKPLGQGTGLGLSMVMDFIRLSKGRMTIRSSPGMGTSINLFLPVLKT